MLPVQDFGVTTGIDDTIEKAGDLAADAADVIKEFAADAKETDTLAARAVMSAGASPAPCVHPSVGVAAHRRWRTTAYAPQRQRLSSTPVVDSRRLSTSLSWPVDPWAGRRILDPWTLTMH